MPGLTMLEQCISEMAGEETILLKKQFRKKRPDTLGPCQSERVPGLVSLGGPRRPAKMILPFKR